MAPCQAHGETVRGSGECAGGGDTAVTSLASVSLSLKCSWVGHLSWIASGHLSLWWLAE